MVNRGVDLAQHLLIKWSEWSDSMATLEDLVSIQLKFLQAPAWGLLTLFFGTCQKDDE